MNEQDLVVRVEALEAQARRWRKVLGGGLVVVALLVLAGWIAFVPVPAQGQGQPAVVPVVRAQRFELVDGGGDIRALLGVTESGPWLGLLDADGTLRASLGDTESGPWLRLSDADGTPRANLGMAEGGPGLALFGPAGKIRVALGVDEAGVVLSLNDATEVCRAGLVVNEMGAVLGFYDAKGDLIWNAPSQAKGGRR